MATRANIVVQTGDDQFKVIYTHYDGYPSDMGVKLVRFYPTLERARALVEPGDIRTLGERCGRPQANDSEGADFCTEYFNRDRGEEGCDGHFFSTLTEALEWCDNDYAYVLTEGAQGWRFGEPTGNPMLDELRPLRAYIDKDKDCQESWATYEDCGHDYEWAIKGEPTRVKLKPFEEEEVEVVMTFPAETHPMVGGWA